LRNYCFCVIFDCVSNSYQSDQFVIDCYKYNGFCLRLKRLLLISKTSLVDTAAIYHALIPNCNHPAIHLRLNTAPIGSGNLLTSGYLRDVRTLFCPSAGDAMPADSEYAPSADGTPLPPMTGVVTSLRQIKRAGGYDGKAMTHGTWSGQSLYRTNPMIGSSSLYINYLTIQSHYNYRNVPSIVFVYVQAHYDAAFAAGLLQPGARIKGIRPARVLLPGEPFFRTQREQGARAILTDSFSSSRNYYHTGPEPGMALYAHRDGYNVLYADGSAKWHGDPQQSIVWYDVYYPSAGGGKYGPFQMALERNCIGSWTTAAGAPTVTNYSSAVDIWRKFDAATGIDVE